DALPSRTAEAAHQRAVEEHEIGHGRTDPSRVRYRPTVTRVYAKIRRATAETNFYRWRATSARLGIVHLAVFPDDVEDLRGDRDGLRGAAELERLQHRLILRLRASLHFGQRHEPADDVAQVRRRLLVVRLGANDATDAPVDVATHREPLDRWNLGGHRLRQMR